MTLVGIAIVIAGAYYWYAFFEVATPWYTTDNITATPNTDTVGADSGPATLPTTGSSNADLDSDLDALDVQLSNLDNDTANATQSLNDQPIEQDTI